MLIRSQDKEKIINLSNIGYVEIEPNFYEGERYYINTNFPEIKIAEYSSKEKAIKVLGMIENFYSNLQYTRFAGSDYSEFFNVIFQMPQDEEVGV